MSDKSLPRALKDVAAVQKWAQERGYPVSVDDATELPISLCVTIPGPVDTPYAGGHFVLQCNIPKTFPTKSPTMAFITKIWHPNVEVTGGAVCLDILKQRWSPIFRIHELYELYIPQLMTYPNPSDPYNGVAARQQLNSEEAFTTYAGLYTRKYAGSEPDLVLPPIHDDDS